MMGDVLEEDEGRRALADDSGDMRPEVARVGGAELAAGDGERLPGTGQGDGEVEPAGAGTERQPEEARVSGSGRTAEACRARSCTGPQAARRRFGGVSSAPASSAGSELAVSAGATIRSSFISAKFRPSPSSTAARPVSASQRSTATST